MEKQRVVLFVGGSLMPFCRFRRALIETLVRDHGCKVVCACWGDSGQGMFQPFQMPGVVWADLGGSHNAAPGARDLRVMGRLFRLVRRHRPDVACCFNAKPIVLAPRVIRAAHRRTRIIALMEGLGTALSFLLDPDARAKRRVFKAMTRPVDRWVLLNARDTALIGTIHPGRATLTLPGIGTDIAAYAPPPDPLTARRLIFIGRLVPEKGAGFFVELARHLRATGRDWRLAMAGLPAAHGGIAPAQIQDWLAEGLIESCRPVRDMPAFYRAASVLIFPSDYQEGLPASIMEAQASGLPCLVLDRPALQGAIRDGETGFLVPDLDPAQWALRLDALSEPQIFARFSANARRYAVEHYDERQTNQRLASALLD